MSYTVFKVLLKNPHPSGKLARWGLNLQDADLVIHYCPRKITGGDSLSYLPVDPGCNGNTSYYGSGNLGFG